MKKSTALVTLDEITVQAQPTLELSLAGKASVGLNIAFPNFHGVFAAGIDGGQSTGFTPVITPIAPSLKVLDASAIMNFDLTPQLGLGIDVADGAFKMTAGIQAGAKLEGKASIGTNNRCESPTQLNFDIAVTGDVGAFIDSPILTQQFTLAQFPTVDLFDKCFGSGGSSTPTSKAQIKGPAAKANKSISAAPSPAAAKTSMTHTKTAAPSTAAKPKKKGFLAKLASFF